MSSKKLYGKLTRELQYKEARDYLERVWERKDKYKIYLMKRKLRFIDTTSKRTQIRYNLFLVNPIH